MVDKLKDSWIFLKDFFADKLGWFVFGVVIGGFISYIQWNRAEQLDTYLQQCSANERALNESLRTCREDASKDFIRSFSEQVEMMQNLSKTLKVSNENTKELIEQERHERKTNSKIINVLESKKKNENS